MLEEGSQCSALVLALFLLTHCSVPQGLEQGIRYTLGIINGTSFAGQIRTAWPQQKFELFAFLRLWGFCLFACLFFPESCFNVSAVTCWKFFEGLNGHSTIVLKILGSDTASQKHYCCTTWLLKQKQLSWRGSRALPPSLSKLWNFP